MIIFNTTQEWFVNGEDDNNKYRLTVVKTGNTIHI